MSWQQKLMVGVLIMLLVAGAGYGFYASRGDGE